MARHLEPRQESVNIFLPEREAPTTDQILYVLSGFPGTGKSTKAEELKKKLGLEHFEADQHFVKENGEYEFNEGEIRLAHQNCLKFTILALENGKSCVVSNTFVQKWQLEPYLKYCRENGIVAKVIRYGDGGFTNDELAKRNVHGLDENTIQEKFRDLWEKDILTADSTPPWLRK